METVTSAEFQRHVGRYQDRALAEPLLVTHNGRERLVVMSAEEYHRLKRRDREVLQTADLSVDDLAEILGAQVPNHYAGLDEELSG